MKFPISNYKVRRACWICIYKENSSHNVYNRIFNLYFEHGRVRFTRTKYSLLWSEVVTLTTPESFREVFDINVRCLGGPKRFVDIIELSSVILKFRLMWSRRRRGYWYAFESGHLFVGENNNPRYLFIFIRNFKWKDRCIELELQLQCKCLLTSRISLNIYFLWLSNFKS